MKRAAIYARYSTALQSDNSIEDQVELCRAYAKRERMAVARVYQDRARSGASMHGRSGIATLLADARAGAFDVVLVEAFDRLARDMGDLADIFRDLRSLGSQCMAFTTERPTSSRSVSAAL